MNPYPDVAVSTISVGSASAMTARFGKSLYTISDPLPTWYINTDGLVECSVCGESLAFMYPGGWETTYPKASDYMTPVAVRCDCFIGKRYAGSARHHELNREPVAIKPVNCV
jgi:hypothetical protein